jgi:hypothetical protein
MKKHHLIAILLAPFLAYGGLKAYLWYGIKSSVDDMVTSMSPFVEVSYGGIFSTLDGEVGIEDIVIQPVMTNDTFTVQSMSLRSESIFDFVNPEERFRNGKFPKQVGWEIQKLKLDLDSKIFHLLSDFQARAQAQNTQAKNQNFLFERLDALGCGDLETFTLADFIDMGYRHLELDVAMDISYLDISRQMQIALRLRDRDLYTADADMKFAFDIEKIKAGVKPPAEPAITALTVNYTDKGYYKLRNAFCARQVGGEEASYIDANVTRLSTELGGVLPQDVMTEYRKFMAEGGTLSVSLSPAEATQLSNMAFYETSDAMRMLGLTVAVNDVSFNAEQMEWSTAATTPTQSAQATTQLANRAKVSPPAVQTKTTKQAAQQPESRKVKVSQLSRYMGKLVQLDTNKGKRRVGRLESIDDERVRILIKMTGGEFSFPVKIEEISSARVLR